MKRFTMGIVVGAILSFTISAHADEISSMLGKEVDSVYPVTLNGQTLANAPVIDGTSYLPVRTLSNALGLEVSFNDTTGIQLTSAQEEVKPTVEQQQPVEQSPVKPTVQNFDKALVKLDDFKEKVGSYQLIEINGAQYVNLVTISGPYQIKWNEPVVLLKRGTNEVTVTVSKTDFTAQAFEYEGSVFIRLSDFSLKASVVNGVLVIE